MNVDVFKAGNRTLAIDTDDIASVSIEPEIIRDSRGTRITGTTRLVLTFKDTKNPVWK